MKSMVHGLEAEYWNRIDFVYLNREYPVNADVVERFGVRYQPVLFLLSPDGEIMKQWFGRVSAEELRGAFDTVLAQSSG